ncbi:MAG: 4-hydroxy-tetrahydrodipicolinate synthase [Eubacteriaceae bacterium]|nr:4-hydroxy-tetrahydrodipicolinate synthase [Eubacteriaceae bacterium]
MLFRGVGTALVTPFLNGKIDYPTIEKLINRQIENGVAAIIISGTTGESPTISNEEKVELFNTSREIINGRVCYIAGTGTNNTAEVIAMTKVAKDARADGVLVNNPYYNKSSDEGVYKNYEAISDAVDIPIIVYNVPSRTGKNITAQLGLELCKIKNVAAFKEACGDIGQIVEFMSKKPEEIQVFSGNDDQTYAILSHGGDGVIATCANIAPRMMVDITDAYFAGNYAASLQAQFDLLDLFKAIFSEVNPIPLKTAMGLVGLCSDEMRLPLTQLTGSKLESLKAALGRNGFKLAQA